MIKRRALVTRLLIVFCAIAGGAARASADESLCPEKVPRLLAIVVFNPGTWSYQEWYENNELVRTEGSGPTEQCYYVGERWSYHPYGELQDPNYEWNVNASQLAVLLENQ